MVASYLKHTAKTPRAYILKYQTKTKTRAMVYACGQDLYSLGIDEENKEMNK